MAKLGCIACGAESGCRLLSRLGPVAFTALLAALILLFGFQGEQLVDRYSERKAAGVEMAAAGPLIPEEQ